MSATLIARELAAGHGDRVLFAGLDLVVAPGDVVGLVGVNGAGKSTLLQLLAGLVQPEEGTVRVSPSTANVGYLPQEPDRREGETVHDFLSRRTGVGAAQRAMDETAGWRWAVPTWTNASTASWPTWASTLACRS